VCWALYVDRKLSAARANGFNYMFFGDEHSIVQYNALRELHWRRNGSAAAYTTAVELFR